MTNITTGVALGSEVLPLTNSSQVLSGTLKLVASISLQGTEALPVEARETLKETFLKRPFYGDFITPFPRCNFTVAYGLADSVVNVNNYNVTSVRLHEDSVFSIPMEEFSSMVLNATSAILHTLSSLPEGEVKYALQNAFIEQLGGIDTELFPTGLFENAKYSFLHSLVCSAVSVALEAFFDAAVYTERNVASLPANKVLSKLYGLSSDAYVQVTNSSTLGAEGSMTANMVEGLYAPVIRTFLS